MTGSPPDHTTGPLSGLRVFDMTRVLAGPTCTQILGDLGAGVIKIERPGRGDDSRGMGPPYLTDAQGKDTAESAYFLSVNRNKRSVTLNLTTEEGQELARRMIGKCDVVVENFRTGALAQYGLAYDQIREAYPALVYCSVTGFGQTGPYAERGGYDYLVQGMGGIMSVTGEPGGAPTKVGVGVSDIITGMYAAIAIQAALRHRDLTGEGQHIDMALLDSQVAWLSYVGE
ncbi:MAG: CoA transferase, partial [Alphaproteobacteria bacterium]|nr:CoA transferase [Alphaproteobacteria bacterium]